MGDPLDGYATQVAPPTPPPAPTLNDLGALQVAPPTTSPAQVAKPAVKTATAAAAPPSGNKGGAGGSWGPEETTIGPAQEADRTELKQLKPGEKPRAGYDPLGGIREGIDKITEGIEAYNQQGRAEHPVLSRLGDVTREVKELLEGGQAAGKPLGTTSGLETNPVVQAIAMAPEAAEMGAAAEGRIRAIPEYFKPKISPKIAEAFDDAGAVEVAPPTKSVVDTTIAPHDFLKSVGANDGGAMSSEQVELYRDMIRKGSDIQPPVIEYDENGNIVGGDGRHRAMAHALEGTERMPVRVHRQLAPEVAEEPRYDLGELQPLRATQNRAAEEGGLHPDVPEKAAAAVREGNGFTFHPTTGETPTTGFAVEAHTEGQTRLDHPATPQDIKDFYEKNKEQFDAHPELHIGGYGNELGVSAVVPEEGRARSLAERLDQKSIWDFENQREIPTGGTGETTQFPHYPLEQRMKDVTGSESSNADNPESQQTATPLQKIADKYGVSDDPSGVKNGASFITSDGQFIHLTPGVVHPMAIAEAEGKTQFPSEDNRPDFLNENGAIRTRFSNDRQGPTLHVSVPEQGVTKEQIPALQQAVAQAGRYGNVVMERADITPETKDRLSMSQEFPRAGDTENYLRRIEAHPDQHAEGKIRPQLTEDELNDLIGTDWVNHTPTPGDEPKILPGGKVLEVPPELLTEGSTTESTLHHEAAHAIMGSLNGADAFQILSHLHPDSEAEGFAAAADFDYRDWGGSAEGHLSEEAASEHVKPMMDMLAAGGMADEHFHGIPWDENEGIGGDQDLMHKIMDAADVPEEDRDALIQQAKDNATKVLTHPGVREIIQKHMNNRPEGLDESLHMDDEGIRAMTDEIKEHLNGNNTEDSRIHGSDNQENDARTESQGEGEPLRAEQKRKVKAAPEEPEQNAPLPHQPKLPEEGQFAAIQTDDGGIYPDTQPEKQRTHIMLAKDLGIPAERIISGGWLKDGVYEGTERSDAGRYGERARAEQAALKHRAANRAKQAETISTRVPTAKKAVEDSMTHGLVIDSKAIYDNPELAKKMANEVRNYPGLKIPDGASDTQVLDAFKEHLKDNIKYVYDQTTPEDREAHGGWYEGANKFAADRAAEHDLTTAQGAGVLASMSPQKDWDMNASLAKRTMDIWDNKQSTKTTPEMMARGKQLASAKNSKGKYTNEAVRALLPKIEGKKLKDLNPDLQALWIRMYDEAHNPREFNKINPDGSEGPLRTTVDGDPERVAWGSLNEIGKSVKILKDGSRDNISKSLGFSHKIRNFFNNIIEPNSPRQDLTADTHAVAAAQLRPLGGNAPEVKKNFGGIMHAMSGTKGTYALYADAYREAAKDLDIPYARSLQSIIWEKIRSEFPADIKSKENLGGIDSIWKEYTDGQISKREAQDAIFEAARGYRDQAFGGGGGASDQGKLFEPSVSGESAPGNGGGRGGNSTSGSLGKRGGVSKGAIDALSFINMMKSQKGASRTGAALMGAGIAGAGAIAALSGGNKEEEPQIPQPRSESRTVATEAPTDVHGLIKKASNDYGVPEAILHAQADQESKFNQDAVSRKGARGVMQLMPNTARSLNVDANDMAQNVDGGARLMSQLHHRFGSYDKALAAYNWSPDKVQDAIDTYGNDWLKHTPAETRNYVLRIMKNSR